MKRTTRFMTLSGISAGLVFFMSGFGWLKGTPQNLAQKPYVVMATVEDPVAMPEADKEDAIVVTVLRDGAVFLASNRIDMRDLSLRARDMVANKIAKEAYIRADARAQFRAVEEVIDALSAADVNDVGLLVRRKSADTEQGYKEARKPSTGLALALLPPSMMKEYFPRGISASMDRVQILRGPSGALAYKINQTDVQKAELLPKLTEMYKNRGERILFIRADDDLDFNSIVEVIDIARGADVDHVAILTPQILAGH
jgi:biopolymer transport protein ExbD